MDEEDPDYKEINDYYRKNPPKIIIDEYGIRHQKEIEIVNLNEYKPVVCQCGITHPVGKDTWYHSILEWNGKTPHQVIKRCKKCHEILILERKNK